MTDRRCSNADRPRALILVTRMSHVGVACTMCSHVVWCSYRVKQVCKSSRQCGRVEYSKHETVTSVSRKPVSSVTGHSLRFCSILDAGTRAKASMERLHRSWMLCRLRLTDCENGAVGEQRCVALVSCSCERAPIVTRDIAL